MKTHSDLILSTLKTWLENIPQESELLVAYSGGRDSHVLLHALNQLRKVNAIHVNHGLQTQSQDWVNHCQQICQANEISLKIIDLKLIIPKGESLENIARQKRYEAFKQFIQPQTYLLTAHSCDDQAETFLLQALRGAGPKGLAGIAPHCEFGKGILARPLLGVSREAIAHYAQFHQLSWIEDPSNDNQRFARNFIRHNVFTQLAIKQPGFIECLSRSAKHCAQMETLLNEYVQQDLSLCLDEDGLIVLSSLRNYTLSKQVAMLRLWLNQNETIAPSSKKLTEMLRQMLNAKRDANPSIHFGNATLRRFNDKLYLMPQSSLEKAQTHSRVHWSLMEPLSIGSSQWIAKLEKGKGIDAAKIAHGALTVAFRKQGCRVKPQGKTVTYSVKKLFQMYKIPIWQRQSMPFFYYQDELVAIGDLLICEGWQVSQSESGWVIKTIV